MCERQPCVEDLFITLSGVADRGGERHQLMLNTPAHTQRRAHRRKLNSHKRQMSILHLSLNLLTFAWARPVLDTVQAEQIRPA